MDFHLVPRGEDRNYTGFLTKTIVYTASLIVFLAGTPPSLPLPSPITNPNHNQTQTETNRTLLSSIRPLNSLNRNPQLGQLPQRKALVPLLLRAPPTLLLAHRHLRELPKARRLHRRGPLLLFHVAVRRVYDVVCACA
jgi:hypothetical protein